MRLDLEQNKRAQRASTSMYESAPDNKLHHILVAVITDSSRTSGPRKPNSMQTCSFSNPYDGDEIDDPEEHIGIACAAVLTKLLCEGGSRSAKVRGQLRKRTLFLLVKARKRTGSIALTYPPSRGRAPSPTAAALIAASAHRAMEGRPG